MLDGWEVCSYAIIPYLTPTSGINDLNGNESEVSPIYKRNFTSLRLVIEPMIGENRQLVTDEPVEFEK